MELIEKNADSTLIRLSRKEVVVLAEILDWISTERKEIDTASTMLESEEIARELPKFTSFFNEEAM